MVVEGPLRPRHPRRLLVAAEAEAVRVAAAAVCKLS
jgi:hypothetical protein